MERHVTAETCRYKKGLTDKRSVSLHSPHLINPLSICVSRQQMSVWCPISSLIISVNHWGMWLAVRSPGDIDANLSFVCVSCLWGCSVRGGFKAVDRFNNSCDCAASSLFPDLSVLSLMLHSSSFF